MHESRNRVKRSAWIFFRDCFPSEFFLRWILFRTNYVESFWFLKKILPKAGINEKARSGKPLGLSAQLLRISVSA
jgi:hypothetical protein